MFDATKEKKISIAQFARESGISEDRVYQWQNRKNRTGSNPKAEDVIKIQDWLRKYKPDAEGVNLLTSATLPVIKKFSLSLEDRVLALETELTVLRAKWEVLVSYMKDQLPLKDFEALEKAAAAVEIALKKSVS